MVAWAPLVQLLKNPCGEYGLPISIREGLRVHFHAPLSGVAQNRSVLRLAGYVLHIRSRGDLPEVPMAKIVSKILGNFWRRVPLERGVTLRTGYMEMNPNASKPKDGEFKFLKGEYETFDACMVSFLIPRGRV